MKLVWTHRAAADRQAIRSYIARMNLRAAIALDELLSLKAKVLVRQFKLGRAGRVEGTRELVVHRHYILIYDVAGDTVRVLRVLHTARQWPPSESDLAWLAVAGTREQKNRTMSGVNCLQKSDSRRVVNHAIHFSLSLAGLSPHSPSLPLPSRPVRVAASTWEMMRARSAQSTVLPTALCFPRPQPDWNCGCHK